MTLKNDFHANSCGAEFTFYHSVSRHITGVHLVRIYHLTVTKRDIMFVPLLTLFFVVWMVAFTESPEESI